ncbi:major facilitator superfamily alpha-ketoglutarate/sugar transporter [Gluconacetobacter johannae DSM 13595]|uniref:MFS transporter n=1 Tax=Gluconacetobacter johannae TaxID=112140 RepID=A0A7W4J9R6_9PROT|nr:MFS transporter [Gluconacetobacter johannae]MBB2177173.1 MFS transporter [Gluconacetobacter johannae]GBQ82187.1 major facilitator superfamily alpha-ketoglutarate/sugar transporter [Gluconacetobacter johannae DSM 13595]
MTGTTAHTAPSALAARAAPALADHHVPITDLRRAAWTCALGSAMEYYDFALYSLASALVLGPLFFPRHGAAVGLIASFGTYFVGFAVRPFGGLLFGALGDRYGRKFVLLLTVTLMGVASACIGLIPTYATIGMWAPVLLVLLRIMQGLGAGAEQAGASVMMTEFAPRGQRGFYAAIPLLGIQSGSFVAACVYYFAIATHPDIVQGWGWRVPFLLSVLILVVAVYMRMHLKESPAFTEMASHHALEKLTLRQFFRNSGRTIFFGMGLRMAENGGASIYQALSVSYLVTAVGIDGRTATAVLMSATIVGGLGIMLGGTLADRFGRVRVYRAAAIIQGVSAFPVWYILGQGNFVACVIAMSIGWGIGNNGMYGAQAALLPEMFGMGHRYGGVAATREISAVFAGGIAPLVGSLIIGTVARHHAGLPHPGHPAWVWLGAYVFVLSAITVAATWFIPDPINRDLQDHRDIL